jgi:hypothetical protein
VGVTLATGIAVTMILFAVQAMLGNAGVRSIDLPNPCAAGVRFSQLPEGRQCGG